MVRGPKVRLLAKCTSRKPRKLMCKLVQGLKTKKTKKPSHAHSLSIEITFQLRAPEGVSQKAALTGDELTEGKIKTHLQTEPRTYR